MNKKHLIVGMGVFICGYAGHLFFDAWSFERQAQQLGWKLDVPIFGDRSKIKEELQQVKQLNSVMEDLKK